MAEETTKQAGNTENAEPGTEKTFTQAELNEIIKTRLDRERETISKQTAQQARDAYIAEQGFEWNGKPIKTEAEYKQALQEAELAENYKKQNLPEDVAKELAESKTFREQYKQTQSQKEKQDADFKAFFDAYPGIDPKTIPQSVWDDVAKGKSLTDSYARFENQSLKEKLAQLEKGEQTKQQNDSNAQSSTGSVAGAGGSNPAYFTREQVNKMSVDEVNRNWKAINESMKKW